MPQKANPDPLELIRGKAGHMIGHLIGLLVAVKGLPSTYNKDLQEDKGPLFDALEMELPIAAGVIETPRVNAARMQEALDDRMLATDLADYLVRKGVPFREAHCLVGMAVKESIERGVPLRELTLDDFKSISKEFKADLYEVFDFRRSVELKELPGRHGQ